MALGLVLKGSGGLLRLRVTATEFRHGLLVQGKVAFYLQAERAEFIEEAKLR